MSQQSGKNSIKAEDRMTETETVIQPVKKWVEKDEESSDEEKERRRGEREELVDSCWSVYFEHIALLQMFSSTHRKRKREKGKEGGRSNKGMWATGASVAVARSDSSWCILWLAHSKRFVVGNQEWVVGMRRENTGNKHQAKLGIH